MHGQASVMVLEHHPHVPERPRKTEIKVVAQGAAGQHAAALIAALGAIGHNADCADGSPEGAEGDNLRGLGGGCNFAPFGVSLCSILSADEATIMARLSVSSTRRAVSFRRASHAAPPGIRATMSLAGMS